jgi:glutamine amidotransferase-like uncharacterized protein
MSRVFVYSGVGISKCYFPYLSRIFTNIQYVDNLDFLTENRHMPTDIICIGGGRGKYVLDNLSSNDILLLKDNVLNYKIRYIGICCGAYLAGKQLVFDNTPKDTLGLCDVISIGPYYKPNSLLYDYSKDNSTLISSHILDTNKNVKAYLNGGGWFTNIPSNYTIVSCYENSCLPNTIVNHQMLLTHIHAEHPDTDTYFAKLITNFTNYNAFCSSFS